MFIRTLTVSELTRYLKDKLESDHYLANVWVQGEISNFKMASSGHMYFTLKDEKSCLRAVMFRSRAMELPFFPEDGMSVIVRGYISLYEQAGQYQLYAREMEPTGAGALYIAFEQLKQRLEREGIFDQKYKKNLPRYPEHVGLVTSPVGAAVQDMVGILRRRWPGIRITLAPVTVQGDDAPREICAAIEKFNVTRSVDVIIVGRGGGSLEELWAFNTEVVARCIFNSGIPVVSAVGHETDFTIADMVADLRAPTPSAAAEIVVPDSLDTRRYLQSLFSSLIRCMNDKLRENYRRLEFCLKSPLLLRPVETLTAGRRQAVDQLQKEMFNIMSQILARDRSRLAARASSLQALSPLATLARGYSICTTPGGEIIRSSTGVPEGSRVDVHLHEGCLCCEVKECLLKD